MSDGPKFNVLSNMTIGEVTLCHVGMNPGATVALFKAADPLLLPLPNSPENRMTTATGDPAGVGKADPPPFKPCTDCQNTEVCKAGGACGKDKAQKSFPLVVPDAAPTADPFGKAAKDVLDGIFKGVTNPPLAICKAVTDTLVAAVKISAEEVAKAKAAYDEAVTSIAKSDDAKTFSQVYPAEVIRADMWRVNDALDTALRSIVQSDEPDDVKLSLVNASLDQFKAVIVQRMAMAIGAASGAASVLVKSAGALSPDPAAGPAGTTASINKTQENTTVSGSATTLSDTLAKAATGADVIKALPESAAKLLEKHVADEIAKAKTGTGPQEDPVAKAIAENPVLKAQFDALKKQADEATALAKAQQDRADHAARVEKAKTDFGALPLSPDEMAGVIKAMDGITDTAVKANLERALKAGNEAIGKHVLGGERGSNATGATAGAAQTEAVAKAAEIRKGAPTLTAEQALMKAYELNPGLYDRVCAEQAAARAVA